MYKNLPATLISKTFIPIYLEHLKFLILRYGWKITKIYTHFIFEQEKFKKNFILMNQGTHQKAKKSIEKYFFISFLIMLILVMVVEII